MQNISGKSQFIGKSPTITVIFGNLWKFPAWTRSRNGNFGKFLEIPEEPEFPKRNFQTLLDAPLREDQEYAICNLTDINPIN